MSVLSRQNPITDRDTQGHPVPKNLIVTDAAGNQVSFSPMQQMQRPALLLANGLLYDRTGRILISLWTSISRKGGGTRSKSGGGGSRDGRGSPPQTAPSSTPYRHELIAFSPEESLTISDETMIEVAKRVMRFTQHLFGVSEVLTVAVSQVASTALQMSGVDLPQMSSARRDL